MGTPNGPSEREHEMANRKLAEAEQRKRDFAINIGPLERSGAPKPAAWYAAQLASRAGWSTIACVGAANSERCRVPGENEVHGRGVRAYSTMGV